MEDGQYWAYPRNLSISPDFEIRPHIIQFCKMTLGWVSQVLAELEPFSNRKAKSEIWVQLRFSKTRMIGEAVVRMARSMAQKVMYNVPKLVHTIMLLWISKFRRHSKQAINTQNCSLQHMSWVSLAGRQWSLYLKAVTPPLAGKTSALPTCFLRLEAIAQWCCLGVKEKWRELKSGLCGPHSMCKLFQLLGSEEWELQFCSGQGTSDSTLGPQSPKCYKSSSNRMLEGSKNLVLHIFSAGRGHFLHPHVAAVYFLPIATAFQVADRVVCREC